MITPWFSVMGVLQYCVSDDLHGTQGEGFNEEVVFLTRWAACWGVGRGHFGIGEGARA